MKEVLYSDVLLLFVPSETHKPIFFNEEVSDQIAFEIQNFLTLV